ncbi:MAG: hypothetical protein IT307_14805, partial [Chloroflexi bacterium]|nr:hypothetical protein [Chloroflexota bacterium]
IGGVISSTLLTLVLVPTMYTLLDDAVIAVRGVLGFRLAFASRRRSAAAATEAAGSHAATVSRVHSLAETRPIQGGALDDE